MTSLAATFAMAQVKLAFITAAARGVVLFVRAFTADHSRGKCAGDGTITVIELVAHRAWKGFATAPEPEPLERLSD